MKIVLMWTSVGMIMNRLNKSKMIDFCVRFRNSFLSDD